MKESPWATEVMLAEVSGPFSADGWLFEIKYDGFRVLAGRDGGRPRVRYRSGADGTGAFPEIVAALAALPGVDHVLDGEVVVLDAAGRPSFQRMQQRFQSRGADAARLSAAHPATLFAFDLIASRGRDLRARPLLERKAALRRLFEDGPALRYVDHVAGAGEALFEEARRLGLEGVVGKRAASPYVAGRSREWRKVRADRIGEFIVVGYTRTALGEEGGLHLAAAREQGLVYAGRVGSGFQSGVLAEARALLEPYRRATPACGGSAPKGRGHQWVEPRILCEVRFKELTEAGLLRHPVFVRFCS
jgi:bifunctional non-homologous end joining protein LigD